MSRRKEMGPSKADVIKEFKKLRRAFMAAISKFDDLEEKVEDFGEVLEIMDEEIDDDDDDEEEDDDDDDE